jgi:phosphopantothenoylcysteine decarboxylase/phosphopantothenate--cysteine ligase
MQARYRGPAADIAVMSAAVADWRVDGVARARSEAPRAAVAVADREPRHPRRISRPERERPKLVVGFAAETTDSRPTPAQTVAQGCDWIVATTSRTTFGADGTPSPCSPRRLGRTWPRQSKAEVARLPRQIADHFKA